MMKRIVSLTLVVIMVAALFVGCGASKPEGTYKVKTINDKEPMTAIKDMIKDELGDAATDEKIEEYVGSYLQLFGVTAETISDFMVMTFENDNVTMKSPDGETKGTWKLDGEKLSITYTDEDNETKTDEYTFKGGEISGGDDGFSLVLAKAK